MADRGDDDYPDDLLLQASISYEKSQQEIEEDVIISDEIFVEALKSFEDETGEPSLQPPSPRKQQSSLRFAAPLSDDCIQACIREAIPKNTRDQTGWAVRVWEAWRNSRQDDIPELLAMNKEEMGSWLSKFLLEARRMDGNEYTGNTLHQMLCGLLRYLRLNGRQEIDFFKDIAFKNMLAVLDSKMKNLRRNGIGVVTKQAEPITLKEEETLWEQGCLGDMTPSILADTMIWMCGLFFALRGGAELRNLTRQQIKLIESPEGSYLEYQENVSKNNPGGLKHRNITPKTVTHYENTSNPSRCFIRLYKLYMSKCPENPVGDAFFLRPLPRQRINQWYSCQPIGHNTLGSTVKRLCDKAGIGGNRTNHSLRASAATRLFHGNVPEQLIMEVTGHKSTDGVRTYKKVVRDQFRDVSNVLQGSSKNSIVLDEDVKKEAESDEHTTTSDLVTPKKGPSPHVTLNGCTNITFNF